MARFLCYNDANLTDRLLTADLVGDGRQFVPRIADLNSNGRNREFPSRSDNSARGISSNLNLLSMNHIEDGLDEIKSNPGMNYQS